MTIKNSSKISRETLPFWIPGTSSSEKMRLASSIFPAIVLFSPTLSFQTFLPHHSSLAAHRLPSTIRDTRTITKIASSDDALASAAAAYTHYLGYGAVVSALVTERLTLCKQDQSEEEFDLGSYADIMYGLAGTAILVSGYFRVVDYGKGWEFYQHSPIFWVKMFLFSIMGAASFFPTTKVIQRAVAKKKAEDANTPLPPKWSPELVKRVTSIVNAELLAAASIPLAATLMARGVGYTEWLPWYVGAFPSVAVITGLGYKYINEALTWEEPAPPSLTNPSNK